MPVPNSYAYHVGMWITIGEKDTAESLGFQYGLIWETVWAAPENQPLRDTERGGLILYPGDRLFVPDKRRKQLPADIDRRSIFRRKGVPSRLRLRLQVNEQSETGAPYVLLIANERIEGFWMVPA